MSYNPNRIANAGTQHRKPRHLDPYAGRKHSQIVSRSGPSSVRFSDFNNRKDTPHGWCIPAFNGKDFEVEYQFMCARNSTGRVRHPTKDRCIRVLAGQLFVIINDETVTVAPNQSFAIEAGVEYVMATSGTGDAEMLVCQGAGYESDLEHLGPAEALNTVPVAGQVLPEVLPPHAHREDSMAHQQAAAQAAATAERRAKRTPVKGRPPLPGQQVDGVNPRPAGAAGFSEE